MEEIIELIEGYSGMVDTDYGIVEQDDGWHVRLHIRVDGVCTRDCTQRRSYVTRGEATVACYEACEEITKAIEKRGRRRVDTKCSSGVVN